jgi:uncharacterized membrane protein YkvA (DUF1232 family)
MPSFARLASVGAIIKAVAPALRPGGPSLGERAGAVPRLVRATLNGEYTGVTKGKLALMLAATGYIISPVDLIPEAVFPILGVADDAMVLSWLASRFVEETENFLEWERAKAGMPYAGTSGPSDTSGASGSGTSDASGPWTGPSSGGDTSARTQTVRGDVIS